MLTRFLFLHYRGLILRIYPLSLYHRLFSHCLVFKVQPILNISLYLLKDTGGDEENRTPDPLLARQVLSQLSYTPLSKGISNSE